MLRERGKNDPVDCFLGSTVPNKPSSNCIKSASTSSGGDMIWRVLPSLNEHPKSHEISCLTQEAPLRMAKLSRVPMGFGREGVLMADLFVYEL